MSTVAEKLHKRTVDRVGETYGRWTVLAFAGYTQKEGQRAQAKWLCRCKCGTEKEVAAQSLKCGDSQSCGCLLKDVCALPEGEAAINYLINSMRRGAEKRSYAFELSKEQIRSLCTQDCHYCGSPPTQSLARDDLNGTFIYNGIDRVDNSKGYVEGNVVSACKHCNRAKRKMGYETFRAWVYQIHKHFVQGGA